VALVTGRIRVGQQALPHCVVELWSRARAVHAAPGRDHTVSGPPADRLLAASRTGADGSFQLEAGTETSGLSIVYRLEDRYGPTMPASHAILELRYHHDHEDAWSFRHPTSSDAPIQIGRALDIHVPDTRVPLRPDVIHADALTPRGALRDVRLDAQGRYHASTIQAASVYRNVVEAASRLFDARRDAARLIPTVFPRLGSPPGAAEMAAPPIVGFYPAMARATGCIRGGTPTAEFLIQPISEAHVAIDIDPAHELYHHLFEALVRDYTAPGGAHTSSGAEVVRAARLGSPPDPAAARAAFVLQLALDFSEAAAQAFPDVFVRATEDVTADYECGPPGQPAFGDMATERYLFTLCNELGRSAGGDAALGFALFEVLAWSYRRSHGLPSHLIGLPGVGGYRAPAPIPYTLPGFHAFATPHLPAAVRTALDTSMRQSGLDRTINVWNQYAASPTPPPAPYDPGQIY
jgi:hypothetical protein